jgi:hypothetical protein
MTEWIESRGFEGDGEPLVRLIVSGRLGDYVVYLQVIASVETYDVTGSILRDDLAAQFSREHPTATNVQHDVRVWRGDDD